LALSVPLSRFTSRVGDGSAFFVSSNERMRGKWPDFLFTLGIRFFCGAVLGVLASFLIFLICVPRGHRAARPPLVLWVFNDEAHAHRPYYWFGAWSLLGGIVAAFTIPRWQTPWYKRDSPNLRPEWAPLDQDGLGADSHVAFIDKSVNITMVGEDGERHEYHSMEELPAEIRSEIEALEAEAMDAKGNELSVTDTQQTENTFTIKSVRRKNVSLYRVIDESGVERTYHSLDEMPPEIRAAISKAGEKFE
jgi:hypothetical protein